MAATEPFTLAGDFPAATLDDWRKLVDAVLKGAPYARLESRTHDGLTIAPLYAPAATAAAVTGLRAGAAWTVMQRVDHPDPAAANAQALDDLENGATGLLLVFAGAVGANGFGLDPSPAALSRALDGVRFDAGITIDLDLAPFARDTPQHVADAVKQKCDPAAANIRFAYDPVTAAALSGTFPLPWSKTAPLMAGLIRALAAAGFRGPFAVGDGRIVHDAGGSESQELAFALAAAVAYLRALEASGMTIEKARDAIYFRLSADADQFLTLAKFRAMRKLWARIAAACGLEPKPALVSAETAWRMLTQRDAYVNLLRNAIAVTASGLGGADAIAVLPHTAPLGLPDEFARRVARNIQLVLLEESSLARVADPAAGSGAIEAMTEQLCATAWTHFQDIEKAGGAWAALESGLIAKNVAAVRSKREHAIARGTDILTGTNAYPDLREAVPKVLDVKPAAKSDAPGASALPRIRLAAPFERLRDKSDASLARSGARPKVFLAVLGKPADYNARASFAGNFFAAGGIEAVMGEPAALAASFKASGAALACLCGADTAYESEAAGAAAALKAGGAQHICLAGRPGEREAALRSAGVQSFIFDGSDALSTLAAVYDSVAP
jgi:methylmalonyl-CoA mutase